MANWKKVVLENSTPTLGTLDVTYTSTFGGVTTHSDNVIITKNGDPKLTLTGTGSDSNTYIDQNITGSGDAYMRWHGTQGDMIFVNSVSSTTGVLTLNGSTGNATFAGTIDSGAITSTGQVRGTKVSISGNAYFDESVDDNFNVFGASGVKFNTWASSQWNNVLTLDTSKNATFAGTITSKAITINEANDGGTTELIINNSAAAGSTDEKVGIRLRHASATGAVIFSERTEDFASSGAQSANLCIQTTKDGITATRMVVADSGTTSFYGNTGIQADSKYLRVGHGNDYTMMHDGTHTYVENSTGELRIYQSSTDWYSIWTKPSGGSTTRRLSISPNGSVTIGATSSGDVTEATADLIITDATEASLYFNDTGAASGKKTGRFDFIDGIIKWQKMNDAGTSVTSTPFQIDASNDASFGGLVSMTGQYLSINAGGTNAAITTNSDTMHFIADTNDNGGENTFEWWHNSATIDGGTKLMHISNGMDLWIGNDLDVTGSASINGATISGKLSVDQNSDANALTIDSESTTYATVSINGKYGLYVTSDISGGYAAKFTRNIAESGSQPLVDIVDDNTSNAETTLRVQQDGSGDILNLFDGATEVFTVLDGGNVGIGTSSPETLGLHINKASTDTSIDLNDKGHYHLVLQNSDATSTDAGRHVGLFMQINSDNQAADASIYTEFEENGGAKLHFTTTKSGTGQERMVIDSDGLVGIGLSSGLSKTLHVDSHTGDASTPNGIMLHNYIHGSDSQIYMYAENDSGTASSGIIKYDPDASTMTVGGSNGTGMSIDSSGHATFAGTITSASSLTAGGTLYVDENIRHSGDTNNYINFTTDTQKFYTDNTVALTIDSSQNATFAGTATFSGGTIGSSIDFGSHGTSANWKTAYDFSQSGGTVTGGITTTDASAFQSDVQVGDVLSVGEYYSVKSFPIAFANGVSHQKAQIRFEKFWGWLEVSISGTYSNQNMSGVLTKKFGLGVQTGSTYSNESRYTESLGATADNFAIGEVTWDSTNSRYYIPIVHRVSTGNTATIVCRWHGGDATMTNLMDAMTISSVYTSDTTTYDKPVIQFIDTAKTTFNGNIFMGTNKDIQFADAGEYIRGDGTDMILTSSNDIKLNTTGNTILDSDMYINGGTNYSQLVITGAAHESGIKFRDSDGNTEGWVYANSYGIGFLDEGGSWMLKCQNNTGIYFSVGETQKMQILNSGNVNIGGSDDNFKLEVGGTTYISGNTVIGRDQALNPKLTISSAAKSSALGKVDTGMPLSIDSGSSDNTNSVGHLAQIGFGLINAYQPVAIGAKVVDAGSYTKCDLVFATRDATSDTAPTERMTIKSDGTINVAGNIEPSTHNEKRIGSNTVRFQHGYFSNTVYAGTLDGNLSGGTISGSTGAFSGDVTMTSSSGDMTFRMDNNATNGADFKIMNGAGNSRADFYIDGNNHMTLKGQKVGINITAPDATLHVNSASAGDFVPASYGDDLLVENNGDGGITIATPDANEQYILFSSPSNNDTYNALIYSCYNSNQEYLAFNTHGGGEVMRLDHNGDVVIPDKLGIGLSPGSTPDTALTIRGNFDGSSGFNNTNPNKGLNISKYTGAGSDYGVGDIFGVTFTAASDSDTDYAFAGVYGEVDAVSTYVGGNIVFATRLASESALTEKVIIDSSGRMGINRTPSTNFFEIAGKVDVIGDHGFIFNNNTSVGMTLSSNVLHISAYSAIKFTTYGSSYTERMRINSKGILGFGTSTFGTSQGASSYKQIKVSDGTVIADSGGTNTASMLLQNAYVGTSNNNFYTQASWASRIMQTTGNITFSTASSGSADAQITWSDRLVIENDGDIVINGRIKMNTSGQFYWGDAHNQGYLNWDTNKVIMGGIGSNALDIITNNTTAIAIDTSQNATFAEDVTIEGDLSVEGAFPFMLHASGDFKGSSDALYLPFTDAGATTASPSTTTDLKQQYTWVAPFATTLRGFYITSESAAGTTTFSIEVATNYQVYVDDTSTTMNNYSKSITASSSNWLAAGLSLAKGNAIRFKIDPASAADQFLVTLVFE